jgi:AraC family transcriptional regulator
MDLHVITSRNSGNGGAPSYATVSRSLGRLAHEWRNQPPSDDGRHSSYDRTDLGSPEAMVQISPSKAVARRVLTWHGMAAETAKAREPCRTEIRFHAPVHLLILFAEGARRDGVTSVEGLPRSALRNYKGKLVFVPADHEYYDWQEPSRLTQAAYFYFDPAVLPPEFETGHANLSLPPRLFFEDQGLWDIAIRLKALVEGSEPIDRLYCESLGVVLAHELVRLGSAETRVEPAVRGGLAGWQQRAVASYIEEHVANQITLATLAQLARLSPYHFSRAFKQTFGMAPHRFHTHRRIERAKSLLTNPAASVTSVGMAVGFCETSSFSAAFRKGTGVTPSSFQRSVA